MNLMSNVVEGDKSKISLDIDKERRVMEFAKFLSGRKMRFPALLILSTVDGKVQQEELSRLLGVHPQTIKEALAPLRESEWFREKIEIEREVIGPESKPSAVLYEFKPGPTKDFFKEAFYILTGLKRGEKTDWAAVREV